MIRTYLILRPAPASLEALVEYYQEHRVIEAAVPYGLQSGQLAHPITRADIIAIGSLWTSAAAYNSWIPAPEREALIDGMASLLDAQHPPQGWMVTEPTAADIDFTAIFDDELLTIRHTVGPYSA